MVLNKVMKILTDKQKDQIEHHKPPEWIKQKVTNLETVSLQIHSLCAQ